MRRTASSQTSKKKPRLRHLFGFFPPVKFETLKHVAPQEEGGWGGGCNPARVLNIYKFSCAL